MTATLDAVVVGGGPNGLAAAIVLARAGLAVRVLEANETVGGGARTRELTLPGFHHDICSAIHPMALVSPFLRSLPLKDFGLRWIYSPAAIAHPLDDGTAAVLEQSIEATGATLGEDAEAWRLLLEPLSSRSDDLFHDILRPVSPFPSHPFLMARFGLSGLQPALRLARSHFKGAHARALFAGCSAHSVLPLEKLASAAFGLVLAVAGHAIGWPCAEGGSEQITRAMVAYFHSLGGSIETSRRVSSLADIPPSRAVLFDLSPRQIAGIAGEELPAGYVRRLRRFRPGPGVFKVDWALDGPIPWKAEACHRAATVHVGGRMEEIAESERAMWSGRVTEKPFVLVAQQGLFDSSRAPAGKQTGWAYCHVPNGCTVDMTDAIEGQIERFAPGFRDRILARHTFSPAKYEEHDANFIGGDMAGGANDLSQFLTRPFPSWNPYQTPSRRFYICSSSTPPGGGVHGMCGYWAATAALKRSFGRG